MIGWISKLLLFRSLPRRVLPFLTMLELAMLARGAVKGWQAAGRRRAADAERRRVASENPGATVGR